MRDEHLVTCRDHFLDSFRERDSSEEPHPRPFKFLTVGGDETELTVLRPGKGKNKESESKPSVKGKSQSAKGKMRVP
jgi:hypothetical protein